MHDPKANKRRRLSVQRERHRSGVEKVWVFRSVGSGADSALNGSSLFSGRERYREGNSTSDEKISRTRCWGKRVL